MEYYLGCSADSHYKIKHISIDNQINTANIYTVYKNKAPYLEVNVPFCNWNQAFNTAYIFMDSLCIGLGEKVYFISIETGKIKEINVSMYFGYFYEHKEYLYVASGQNLYCFDCTCNLIWTSDTIAIDGVLVTNFEHDTMLVSCEMDPPDGWISRHLSLKNGKENKVNLKRN